MLTMIWRLAIGLMLLWIALAILWATDIGATANLFSTIEQSARWLVFRV